MVELSARPVVMMACQQAIERTSAKASGARRDRCMLPRWQEMGEKARGQNGIARVPRATLHKGASPRARAGGRTLGNAYFPCELRHRTHFILIPSPGRDVGRRSGPGDDVEPLE